MRDKESHHLIFSVTQGLDGILDDLSLYWICTNIRIDFTHDHKAANALLSAISNHQHKIQSRSHHAERQMSEHGDRLQSMEIISEGEVFSTLDKIHFPPCLQDLTLRNFSSEAIWSGALALPKLGGLTIEGVKFDLPEPDEIHASASWYTFMLGDNNLTNHNVMAILQIRIQGSHLKAAHKLRVLHLMGNRLSSSPLLDFRSCQQLRVLNLSENPNLGPGLLAENLPHGLVELDISNCGISIAKPRASHDPSHELHIRLDFRQFCKALETLSMSDNVEIEYLPAYLVSASLRELRFNSVNAVIDPTLTFSTLPNPT